MQLMQAVEGHLYCRDISYFHVAKDLIAISRENLSHCHCCFKLFLGHTSHKVALKHSKTKTHKISNK